VKLTGTDIRVRTLRPFNRSDWNPLSVSGMKPDLAVVLWPKRGGQLANSLDDGCKLFVVHANAGVQFGEFFNESFLIED